MKLERIHLGIVEEVKCSEELKVGLEELMYSV
jgi:hypothetical protein